MITHLLGFSLFHGTIMLFAQPSIVHAENYGTRLPKLSSKGLQQQRPSQPKSGPEEILSAIVIFRQLYSEATVPQK